TIQINGERDPQTGRWLPEHARRLSRARTGWVEQAGHAAREDGFIAQLVGATDHFARDVAKPDVHPLEAG
ncbi:MAG: hypothetical protein R3304_08565, partial [Longimicrobiales bacterium]|nr:hypothetical protein [Longimicrobiales bacterium]